MVVVVRLKAMFEVVMVVVLGEKIAVVMAGLKIRVVEEVGRVAVLEELRKINRKLIPSLWCVTGVQNCRSLGQVCSRPCKEAALTRFQQSESLKLRVSCHKQPKVCVYISLTECFTQ